MRQATSSWRDEWGIGENIDLGLQGKRFLSPSATPVLGSNHRPGSRDLVKRASRTSSVGGRLVLFYEIFVYYVICRL